MDKVTSSPRTHDRDGNKLGRFERKVINPMKLKYGTLEAVMLVTLGGQVCAERWHQERGLWFDAPASEWNEALPVGNGRLGAMVLGTYPQERIQLNEDSIWAKAPLLRHSETTKNRIAEAQELVNAGRYEEAHQLYESKIIMGDAPVIGSYQTRQSRKSGW